MDTTAQLSENTRQGFDGIKAGISLGRMGAKTNTATGLRPRLRRKGARKHCYDYLPFGRILSASDNGRSVIKNTSGQNCHPAAPDDWITSSVDEKFTGQKRDPETGLDYFGARYMSAPQGRFMSPDPLMASASVYDPQSWNRYVYGRNNPLRYIDPLGLFASPAYYCIDDDEACLNNEHRRILENSGGKIYWESLSIEKQNAFVNITDTLRSIIFEDGTTALNLIQNTNDVFDDRILGNSVDRFLEEISSSSLFDGASAKLHKGFENSVKTNKKFMSQGNLQISFNANGSFDIDHDLFKNPVLHFFGEVIPNHSTGLINKVFNTSLPEKTNQDYVRKMLIANPAIGITPSPDSKFNRK